MIIINLGNLSGQPNIDGMAVKVTGESTKDREEQPTIDFCPCQIECTYFEKVFYEVGSDYVRNDKNSFLYTKSVATDTITIKLFKNGVELATITDNTYGEYHNGFTTQPLYIGFIIDWLKVFQVSGVGRYQVVTYLNILGVSSTVSSQLFQLYPFSAQNANRTVKIEWLQQGNIIGNDLDYTDLLPDGWPQSFRINGKFYEDAPGFEVENFLTQNYVKKQLQDVVKLNYVLETGLLPREIMKIIDQDMLLGNEILMTDYNIINEDIYRRVSVYPDNVDKEKLKNNLRTQRVIKFTDKNDQLRKRNF